MADVLKLASLPKSRRSKSIVYDDGLTKAPATLDTLFIT